ncbi:MAG: RrF2 family transcriptional regulator [Candidatus Eiseniibacteriota bacterium]|jgi:Rrf2 family protein
MRISSRGQYGIRALAVLAARHGQGPVQAREIARTEGLSAKYLEQLLGRLRSGGLVRSVRGARGGYTLARQPDEINVREVLLLLEGSLAPVACVDGAGHVASCPAHGLWSGLFDTVLRYLDSYTLADLIRSAGAAQDAVGAEVAVAVGGGE